MDDSARLLFANIAYRGVEPAGNFSFVAARPKGFGVRGWQECIQLDQGYTPVVLAVDSAWLLFPDIAYCQVELASEFLFVAARRRGFGDPRRWERRKWDEPVPPGYFSFFSETEVVLKGTPQGTPG